jgi:hypothetical protein
MNGLGLKYWANDSGRNVMPGLAVGLGVLLMVLTQFLPERYSTVSFVVGICFIATGIIDLVIRHLMRRRLYRDDK